MQTTEKRIFSGVFVGFISFALGFIQAILLVPILLTFWGNETYGIWLVLNAGYIILQTLDSGQQSFIGNELNIKFFSDKNELRTVLASSLQIAFVIGILQLIIVFFLILSNTSHLFLGLDAITVEKEYLSICLLLFVISWISSGTYTSILTKLMIPYGYYSKSIWWSIYNKIGSFIILVIIAMNHGDILDATIGISIFTIVFNYLFLYRIKVLIPDVYPWWKNANWKTGFNNLKKSSLISGTGILAQFSNNGLVILITYVFGAVTVPIFTTLRTLTNSATQITNTLIQPLQPELVKFSIKKDFTKLLETFDLNWIISGFLINVGILIVLPFLPDLYHLWTRGKIEFNLNLFLLLALGVSIFNFGSVMVYYLHSLNRVIQQFTLTLVKFCILFFVSLLLSNLLGLLSVGIGIVLSELIGYMILPYWFNKKEFRAHSSRYNYKTIFTRTLPNIFLLITFIFISINSEYTLEISIIGILVLLYIYFRLWKNLSKEFRQRILLLFNLNK